MIDRRKALVLAIGAGALIAGAGVFAATQGGPANEYAAIGRSLNDVELTNSRGEVVRWGRLAGAPRAVFFGFTHCPVICPVTIYELTAAADRIGVDADAFEIQFITVDPQRDTVERMTAYFSGFGPRVTGYTGSQASLDRMMRGFEVSATRVELSNGDYTIDHTATVFLLDESGRVVDVVAYGAEPTVLEERLRDLLAR